MDRFPWVLALAISGAHFGGLSCAGRSSHGSGGTESNGGAQGTGATSGRSSTPVGGSGGTLGGGKGVGAAGSGAEDGGLAGTGGVGGGGRGATAGSNSAGDGGEFPVPPFPCLNESEFSSDLVSCDGGFVHRPTATACPPIPEWVSDQLEQAASGGEGGGPSIDQGCYSHTCDPGEVCIWTEPNEVRLEDCARPCETDGDCGTNELCACASGLFLPALAVGPGVTLGICRSATCRTDSDCGPGMLCISNFRTETCEPVPGHFRCQSPADECAGTGGQFCSDNECVHDGERFVCSEDFNVYC